MEERDHDESDRDGEEGGEDGVENRGEYRLAEGADSERGERDAQLHRGDEPRRAGDDLEHVAGAAVALLLQLDDFRPARGHEAVLGGHEERIQEQQPDKGGQLEGDSHAPVSPGAQVLGGRSSSKLARSIGNGSDVLDAFGALLEHEPLEVGERLRDREAA